MKRKKNMSRKARNSTEVLKAAKWMIENVGWVQGQGQKYDVTIHGTKITAVCASSALGYVEVEKESVRDKAITRLAKAMGSSIIGFNDHEKTTKKMVLNRFQRAIKGSK